MIGLASAIITLVCGVLLQFGDDQRWRRTGVLGIAIGAWGLGIFMGQQSVHHVRTEVCVVNGGTRVCSDSH